MSSIPRGALQRDLSQNVKEHLRPDIYIELEARCLIEEVYNKEIFERQNIPKELVTLYAEQPGASFAKVKLIDNSTHLYLPFVLSTVELLNLYGNAEILKGKPGKILYRNNNIRNGRIVVTGNPFKLELNTFELSNIFDISYVLS